MFTNKPTPGVAICCIYNAQPNHLQYHVYFSQDQQDKFIAYILFGNHAQ